MDEKQEEKQKTNTFAEMESVGNKEAPMQNKEATTTVGEVNIEDFSDTAVGEKKKYVRPDLNGQEDVIDKFQVFTPDTTEEPKVSQSGASKYWPVTQILTYGSKNADDVQNREYISGARVFSNKAGIASEINFWYKGGENQSCVLWEKVAGTLGITPEELSPRQYIAFLNSKPKTKIEGMQYDNYGAPVGSPKKITKNMPGTLLKA